MPDAQKLTKKERTARAVAGVSQGTVAAGTQGIAGLGLLALNPYLRRILKETKNRPPEFRTDTMESLGGLADRLSRAGGRNPDVGRPLVIDLQKTDGVTSVTRELWKKKTQPRARDVLNLGLGAKPESIAHEIGHVTADTRLGKLIGKIAPHLRSYPAQMIPSLLAATALLADPDKETPIVAKAAPYIGAAQLATILGEEVRANHRGLKLLKRIGYKTPLNKSIGRHIMALPYLGRAAMLVGAPVGVLKGIEAYDKARELDRPRTIRKLLTNLPTTLADTPSPKELKEKWAPRFK